MNTKGGSGIVVGLIVALGDATFHYVMDRSKDKDLVIASTAATVVEVRTQVKDLTEQVKRLLEQPYVGRNEFEGRLSGLEQRVTDIERSQQSYPRFQNHR